MKKNNWVFYFFITLFAALISVNLIWRLTPIKSEIRSEINERLTPIVGEAFKVKDFSLGFGYISFHDLHFVNKKKDFSIDVDEIQIGYSIHKFLFHKMDPLRMIESITLIDPKILFKLHPSPDTKESKPDSVDISNAISNFKKMTEIDRILIKGGEIQWEKSPHSPKTILSDLDGFLHMKTEKQASFHLIGKIFDSSADAMSLNGALFFDEKKWNANIQVQNCRLQRGLPFLDKETFFVQDALVNGTILVTGPSFNILDLKTKGRLKVENMNATLFNQRARSEDFFLTFQEQKMLLDTLVGSVEDGQFILSGNLGEIFQPGVYADVRFKNYSAKNIMITAPILDLLNRGKLEGTMRIAGPAGNLVLTGQVFSPKLYYNIAPFYNAHLDFIFEKRIWTFNDIRFHSIGMEHRGTGHIDFNNWTSELNISSHKYFGPNVFPIVDRLNNANMNYYTTMQGDFNTLTFTGTIVGSLAQKKETLTTLDAHYTLIDDYLKIASSDAYPGNLAFYGEISKLWDDPTFDILEVKDLPLKTLSSIEAVRWIARKYQPDIYFSGPINYPSVKINFVNRKSLEKFFTFTGSASHLLEPNLKFNSHFTFATLPQAIDGMVGLENRAKNLLLKIQVPRMAEGNLTIGQGENAPFSGQFTLNQISLHNYLGRLPGLSRAVTEGMLKGNVDISGTTSSPEISFAVEGKNFIINQNGYYTAFLNGNYQNYNFSFRKALVTYNNKPVFQGDFTLNPETNAVDAHFVGQEIESNFIAATIFNNPKLIKGKLQYDIKMKGDFDRPTISGTASMQEGEMENRVFKKLSVNFRDSIPPAATLFQLKKHIFKISDFTYEDQKKYLVEANGLLAVAENGPLDMRVNLQGNILAELPAFLEYFQHPDCEGKLYAHLTGSRENLKIAAGKLKIFSGSLAFESVIPPLTGLQADIELREGEQFVHINNLEGKINEHSARIFNIDSSSVKGGKLKPWYFEDLGVNFGVLVLETDPSGIPLSVPGLMNPGDIGNFAVEGKETGEKFYFAGPVDLPHCRGKVILYDCRVTFPFLMTDEEWAESEDSFVMDFLMNVDWDVMTTSGRGNRYFVDIPAVIDQVYMDLDIDDVSKGLEFSGRLIDDSFRTEGEVESTRGRVEYLDMNFRVDKFGAEFSRFELWPRVYGRAWTTVRDSTNFPRDIYLVLYAIDPETKQEVARGRWDDFRFKLVSSDPTITETQESVLAYMGYSVGNLSTKAGDVGLTLTENYLIRPLVRPLERKLERSLKLDYVRLRSNITSNLFYYGLQNRLTFLQNHNFYYNPVNNNFDPALLLLQSSEVIFGKYLMKDLYFTYSGQLVSIYDESKIGLNNRISFEYRILRNLLLDFEYDKLQFDPQFYSREALRDFRIRLRHSFNF